MLQPPPPPTSKKLPTPLYSFPGNEYGKSDYMSIFFLLKHLMMLSKYKFSELHSYTLSETHYAMKLRLVFQVEISINNIFRYRPFRGKKQWGYGALPKGTTAVGSRFQPRTSRFKRVRGLIHWATTSRWGEFALWSHVSLGVFIDSIIHIHW